MQKQRLHKYYENIVVEDLLLLYNYSSIMQIPFIEQVRVSTTSKSYLLDKKAAIPPFAACYLLTGQKSVPTRAHKSIAAFKLREKSLIGCVVTLRSRAMYALIDKCVSFILPRAYDYSVSKVKSEKRHNHINMGIYNLSFLPEIEVFFELFEHIQGINIVVAFSVPRPFVQSDAPTAESRERSIAQAAMQAFNTIDQEVLQNKRLSPIGGASLLSALQYPKV